ncbi:MAG: endolytic transglycosylase MltG [Acidobacteriaceae bacterium]|jgi:UPF0755 protein|nr:endolytic transglycosylase MltG [Acidobacteriaceae bacterium]
MKRLRWPLAAVFLLAAAAIASLFLPAAPTPAGALLNISHGSSTRQIGAQLARQGILRYSWQLPLARLLQPNRTLQAGEYEFNQPATPWQIFDRLARGDVHFYLLRIPEGYNIFDIAKAVAEPGLISETEFLAAARNPQLIQDLAPGAPTLEGFLFPSTYRLTRATTAQTLCAQMVAQFRREWAALRPTQPVLPTVTLASLVEKETSVPAERPLVAGVYAKRLALGMKLDADPTTIYSALLLGNWRGAIYRSDLDRPHPYNTYKTIGLPPGPIANPGAAALAAALHPATTDNLFFVARADGSGAHRFSPNAAAHQRAVADYRRGQQKTATPTTPHAAPQRAN